MSGCRISTVISETFDPTAIQDWDALESPRSLTPPPLPASNPPSNESSPPRQPIINARRAGSNDPFNTRARPSSGPPVRYGSNASTTAQESYWRSQAPVQEEQAHMDQRYFDSPSTSPRLRPQVLSVAEIPMAENILSPGPPAPALPRESPQTPKRQNTWGSTRTPPRRQVSTKSVASNSTWGSSRRRESMYSIPIMPPIPSDYETNPKRSDSVNHQRLHSSSRPGTAHSASTYSTAAVRQVPRLDLDLSEYKKINLQYAGDQEEEKPNTRKSISRFSGRAGGTIKRHLSTLIGTIKRPGTSNGRRGSVSYRDRGGEHESLENGKGYSVLNADEESEPIGIDISTWGPEFMVPNAAAKAMEECKMDPRFAYTGAGQVIDLSNLVGLEDERNRHESDVSSLCRAGTMENSGENSYYFPPLRKIPNWKPVPMRPWFILSLLLISVAMVIGLEILYYKSNTHKFRPHDMPPCYERKTYTSEQIAAAKSVARNTTSVPGLWGFCDVKELSAGQFMAWKYIPTLVGVLYGILWKVTDTEIKRCEPYYQLAKGSSGSLAASSLNIEYDTFWSVFVPFAALRHRQWVVVASSVASLIAFAIVPTLLSVVLLTTPDQNARQRMYKHNKNLNMETIEKYVIVDVRYTQLSVFFLITIIILGLFLLYKLERRHTGLIGDPSGIAGVAAMANKSHILMDFKGLDQASEDAIHKQLNKRTYILHKGALWQAQLLKESERDPNAPKPMNAHPLLLRLKGMLPFMGFVLFVIVLIPILVKNQKANVLMNKAPWFVIGLTMVIKSLWEIVEKDIRMLEPFWQLYNRRADSSVLTLDYSATIPGVIVVKALSKRHFLLAWVSFVTLLIEVLSVVMGSVDYNGPGGEESVVSEKASFALTMSILIIILATMALLLYFRRRTFLPRQPGTISSVLAFIHQSKMLTDFEDTEEKTTLQRKKQLEKIGKEYAFGWFVGRDGQRHLGIDQEPLLQQYQFGKDPNNGVIDSLTNWDTYEH